jgi:hypothetical protein
MTAHPPAAPESGPAPERRPPSPLQAVTKLSRPLVSFVWVEKRGVALTALLYVLGLVVWSLNAARRDLGFGAGADLQYLVAGLVPAFVLAVALALIVAWLRLPAWSRDRLQSWRPAIAARIASLGAVLLAAGALGGALGWTGLLDRFPVLDFAVYAAVGVGVVLLGLAREESWLFRLVWYVYAPFVILLLVAAAFAFYAEGIYPSLPQSLGGGRPRCAQLDLDARSLSLETLAELAPGAAAGEIVRTPRLDIVFAQGDTLFVRRPDDDRVVELRGGSIRAVAGCA